MLKMMSLEEERDDLNFGKINFTKSMDNNEISISNHKTEASESSIKNKNFRENNAK